MELHDARVGSGRAVDILGNWVKMRWCNFGGWCQKLIAVYSVFMVIDISLQVLV